MSGKCGPPKSIFTSWFKQLLNLLEKPAAATETVVESQDDVKAKLDAAVVPILMKALEECANQRPEQPIDFVANYLLQNNP